MLISHTQVETTFNLPQQQQQSKNLKFFSLNPFQPPIELQSHFILYFSDLRATTRVVYMLNYAGHWQEILGEF